MAFPFAPKPGAFTAATLIERIRTTFRALPDVRRGGNNQRSGMEEAALSAFSVFFTQSPSFLDYPVRRHRQRGKNNAQNLFGVHQIPSDNQIRNLLDPVSPQTVFPLFAEFSEALDRHAYLQPFRSRGDTLLVALDGTEYFCSPQIHGVHCSHRTLRNGATLYYHVALTPVIVAPGQEAVVPLVPEFVSPQDGHDKQDGELAAAGRWLEQWGGRYTPWGITLLGDDLYCPQPFCRQARAQGMHFLLVCRPESHPTLYEWVADFARSGQVHTVVKKRWTGKQRLIDTYH